VLVDSSSFHYEAFRLVLAQRGLYLEEAFFRAQLLGLRNDVILTKILGPISPEEIRALADQKEELFRNLIAGRVRPLPGAAQLVRLAQAMGMSQAVVSSTPRQNIQLLLGEMGMRDAFSVLIGEEDVARGKPDPEGFLKAADSLGIPPHMCTVIEDAPEGVQAAKRAGMRCLAVATTRPPHRLRRADLVVPTLEDRRARAFLFIEKLR